MSISSMFFDILTSIFIVAFLGIANELFEHDLFSRDGLEDMIGNFIGIILSIIL